MPHEKKQRTERLLQTAEEAQTELCRHAAGYLEGHHSLGENGGFSLVPEKLPKELIPSSVMIDDYGSIWNEERFMVPRAPLEIGVLEHEFSKVTPGISCHSMPIKFPGTEIRVPKELEQFLPAIKLAAEFEATVNPHYEQCYAYIGVDQSMMKVGAPQRSTEIHTDGIQGPRIQPKIPIEHTYLCIDRDPTKVYVQPFNLRGATADTHLLTPIFEAQAKEDSVVLVRPYVLTLLDAYTVHQAVPAEESGIRTLIKISFSKRIFDRRGNTRNELFDYNWETHARPIPSSLIRGAPPADQCH